ncbi:MAG: site-specific integrase, partial [Alphaproteobacteria bacterium]
MATIRKRDDKYQVQVRRKGQHHVTRTFTHRRDAEQWAREMEVEADKGALKTNLRVLEQFTLGNLVERYRDTISVDKKGREIETIVLNAFLRHQICSRRL